MCAHVSACILNRAQERALGPWGPEAAATGVVRVVKTQYGSWNPHSSSVKAASTLNCSDVSLALRVSTFASRVLAHHT